MTEARPYRSYIPNTPSQQREIMDRIGARVINDLFSDIPREFLDPELNLQKPMTELELVSEMRELSKGNKNWPSFLGAGAYRRFQPAVVGTITGRDENLTSYTPYQAEISQGTLQAAFEFQTAMCNLYGEEVSNVGMYDGASAMAEGALMALRVQEKKNAPHRKKIRASDSVNPNWLEVTKTYLSGRDIEFEIADDLHLFDNLDKTAAVIVQSPNYFGNLEKLKDIGEKVHEKGALFIVASDPVSLSMLIAPGEAGADIAIGEGQSLGNPLHLGGVNLGIFTSKMEYVRQMPGRIVGKTEEKTTDKGGRAGYVLTLQAREQHIQRERHSTSNICTAEQLVALASTIYLSLLGAEGLKKIAELNYRNAHHLASLVTQIPGYELAFPDKPFFNEFVVTCPAEPADINRYLLGENIIGGMDVSDRIPQGMLLCATEMTKVAHMNQLVKALQE